MPAELTAPRRITSRVRRGNLQAQLFRQREPQWGGTAVLRRKINGQAFKAVLLAGGPVQVEQRHPQFQLLLRVVLPMLL